MSSQLPEYLPPSPARPDPSTQPGAGGWPATPPEQAAGWSAAAPPPVPSGPAAGEPYAPYPPAPSYPPAPPYAPYGVPYGYAPPMPPATSGWAIASLICAIAGLCTYGLGSIAGIITGHVALAQIRRSSGRSTGRGLAIAGLIIGYAGLALYVLLTALVIWASNNVMPSQ